MSSVEKNFSRFSVLPSDESTVVRPEELRSMGNRVGRKVESGVIK